MNKGVHIIIKRSGISNSVKHFIDYQNSLTEIAKKSDGFIKSDTFIKYEDNLKKNDKEKLSIVSISKWKDIKDWDNFKESQKRLKIYNNYKELILNESLDIYDYKTNFNTTPLL